MQRMFRTHTHSYTHTQTNTNIIGIQPPLTEYDLYRSSLKSFNMVRSLLENMPSKAEVRHTEVKGHRR